MDTQRVRVAPGHKVYHEGRDRLEGETFVLPEKQARLLIKLGKLIDATADTPPLRVAEPRPARVQSRSLLPDDETPSAGRGRRYRRTDMRSED